MTTKTPEERLSFYAKIERHAIEVLVVGVIVASLLAFFALLAFLDVRSGQDDATKALNATHAQEARSACTTGLIGQELGWIIAGLRAPIGNDRNAAFDNADAIARKLTDVEESCP